MKNVTQLTIHLPESEVAFLKDFAERRKVTVSQLIDQYVKQLRIVESYSHHPDVDRFAGIVADEADARATYYEYIEKKHK